MGLLNVSLQGQLLTLFLKMNQNADFPAGQVWEACGTIHLNSNGCGEEEK